MMIVVVGVVGGKGGQRVRGEVEVAIYFMRPR